MKNLRIFDVQGALVFEASEKTSRLFLDWAARPSGVYYVQAEVDGVMQTVRMVLTD
jgi:hypothetical protein